ncbi:hypothetical protein KKF61_02890 [Patescibacteria group bacterium]|nr:hypothetical protein [Patescibacteria group bacterium]
MDAQNQYREINKTRPWWAYLIITPMFIAAILGFIQQILLGQPFGANPAPDWGVWLVLIVFGIGLPWLFIASKQTIIIHGKTVSINLVPLWKTTFTMDQVVKYYPRDFEPMRDFWGWGIRYGLRKGSRWIKACVYFNENRGVQFELQNGRRLLIGSRQTDQFIEALNKAKL